MGTLEATPAPLGNHILELLSGPPLMNGKEIDLIVQII